jgi:splicing factor 3B subunit 1
MDVDKFEGYDKSIDVNDDVDDGAEEANDKSHSLVGQYTASRAQLDEFANSASAENDILTSREAKAQIQSRETDYQKRRFNRALSPTQEEERALAQEEERVQKIVEEKREADGMTEREKTPVLEDENKSEIRGLLSGEVSNSGKKRAASRSPSPERKTATSRRSRWTNTAAPAEPTEDGAAPPRKRTRWDKIVAAPAPTSSGVSAAAAPAPLVAFSADILRTSIPLSDADLDFILPTDGFKVLDFPAGVPRPHIPATDSIQHSKHAADGFMMLDPVDAKTLAKDLPTAIPGVGELAYFKEQDMKYFSKLADSVDENELSVEELKTRKIMRLLLKYKNGTPSMRKSSLRTLTDNARAFGPQALFDQILPLLMERSLEDQERHLLVKVIDRILYKLGDLVRPYTRKILVVIEPLLIDADHYARIEGREIIQNLSKAAGLAHMISVMRVDVDHADEYVRNTTARAFAIVASALGIPALLPFIKAVCRSKKAWEARHTGIKIVNQIAINMGCAVLPHLKGLVGAIAPNLDDEQPKVKTAAALAIAALAEAANPYGIESFDEILSPLWLAGKRSRGKNLAAFLKAIGFIIPLMDTEYASYYSDEISSILIREFTSADEEMKKTVLKVVSQIASTEGVSPEFLKAEIRQPFFKHFWNRRMALDKRNYRLVIETTVDLGKRIGCSEILSQVHQYLKDDNEPFRKMTAETVEKMISSLGAADIDNELERKLVYGVLFAFEEQTIEEPVILNAFGTLVNSLGARTQPYLNDIVSMILYRLDNKNNSIRQQAADLISRIAFVIKQCDDQQKLQILQLALYENLGEEYPDVLGSILGALRAIVSVVGIHDMRPPANELLPRLTPIMKNRHEKVQENTIDLVGRIADRGARNVHAKEWMRICFELLDMLKAHRKGIRRAANNTFGYIAKAVGPGDVVSTLLGNLRVQERQSRVCTAVALGIVAETCAPFTVLPALMNEYRVPELNVQNGVVKALSFVFEYVGEMAKDYVYAITPLLEDALTDRDQVHRQTAASVVRHIALGVTGLGCEDAIIHLLNLLMPNIFETSPHVIDRMIEAMDACRNAVGTGVMMNYMMAGLFHPARKVRTPYWRLYHDAYVQSADAMVPYYPTTGSKAGDRPELFISL